MIKTLEYSLPDIDLLRQNQQKYLLWIPDKTYIVLGASNNAEEALHTEHVKVDDITVLKRPSGGQTVMLTPNNLIISVVFSNSATVQPKEVFGIINNIIISVLQQAGLDNLSQKGISDICIGGKKILGSSIYRSKDALLYHAVLNIAEPSTTFEKYLKHPSREPEYRNGRKHSEFVTSLKEKGYTGNGTDLADQLACIFDTTFTS